jgi:PIN domain nuclease of toxin-antitoxin system
MGGGNAYLLDSHALLWWWFDPDRLSGAVRDLLSDPTTPVLVSAAFGLELSLKHHQGKLPELSGAIDDLPGLLRADGFEALPISLAHGLRAAPTARPTAIPSIACSPPRPNWIAWCCSPPIPNLPLSPAKPSGEFQGGLERPHPPYCIIPG